MWTRREGDPFSDSTNEWGSSGSGPPGLRVDPNALSLGDGLFAAQTSPIGTAHPLRGSPFRSNPGPEIVVDGEDSTNNDEEESYAAAERSMAMFLADDDDDEDPRTCARNPSDLQHESTAIRNRSSARGNNDSDSLSEGKVGSQTNAEQEDALVEASIMAYIRNRSASAFPCSRLGKIPAWRSVKARYETVRGYVESRPRLELDRSSGENAIRVVPSSASSSTSGSAASPARSRTPEMSPPPTGRDSNPLPADVLVTRLRLAIIRLARSLNTAVLPRGKIGVLPEWRDIKRSGYRHCDQVIRFMMEHNVTDLTTEAGSGTNYSIRLTGPALEAAQLRPSPTRKTSPQEASSSGRSKSSPGSGDSCALCGEGARHTFKACPLAKLDTPPAHYRCKWCANKEGLHWARDCPRKVRRNGTRTGSEDKKSPGSTGAAGTAEEGKVITEDELERELVDALMTNGGRMTAMQIGQLSVWRQRDRNIAPTLKGFVRSRRGVRMQRIGKADYLIATERPLSLDASETDGRVPSTPQPLPSPVRGSVSDFADRKTDDRSMSDNQTGEEESVEEESAASDDVRASGPNKSGRNAKGAAPDANNNSTSLSVSNNAAKSTSIEEEADVDLFSDIPSSRRKAASVWVGTQSVHVRDGEVLQASFTEDGTIVLTKLRGADPVNEYDDDRDDLEEEDLELGAVQACLPSHVRLPSQANITSIILDEGQPAKLRVIGDNADVPLGDLPITQADLQTIVGNLGGAGMFSDDNCAPVPGHTLHCASAIKHRNGTICGLTIRLGRPSCGALDMVQDLAVAAQGVAVFGVQDGYKTALLREIARFKSLQGLRVLIVDQACQIAGANGRPHPSVGSAMCVDSLAEAVFTHNAQVVVMAALYTRHDAELAVAATRQGVQVVCGVAGWSFQDVASCSALEPLMQTFTGIEMRRKRDWVIISDMYRGAARDRPAFAERRIGVPGGCRVERVLLRFR